jgi:hypothetical protein
MATIGIKPANGHFYPLFDENAQRKKENSPVPARKRQKQAQRGSYKSEPLPPGNAARRYPYPAKNKLTKGVLIT